MINPAHVFGGLRIIEDPNLDDMPKMTVSTRFAELMPTEFVSDLNAWMLEFFGTECRIYQIGGDTVYMGPKSIAALHAQLERGVA
ncbi:TPA: hypothetical protein ACK3Q6_001622 [Burkholderia cepacia]|uniref:hypothetical protein n=1 Tax=Burkholderia cepacia TaxID=292 RepID=UPI001CF29E48|nr:hypothetical protein [Burkholderia cepacia]MCA8363191.1 hypothetical protein [Burkholderia cepacia]HDR9756499.1 hypothetical protein [Burkholderia cepacia ATCC 25416]HDV6364668.1 hypothetical protein [Burkholderia cepacia]